MGSTTTLTWLTPQNVVSLTLFSIVAYILISVVRSIHSVYYGPLSKFPGPKIRAFTILPKMWYILTGNEHVQYIPLHEKYGPVVRTAPEEISFVATGQAWKDIHGFKKGPGDVRPIKDPLFIGKPLNGIHTLLTLDDAEHGRIRKILSHAFADRSIKDLEPMLKQWMHAMVAKLDECSAIHGKIDILKYFNCTTFDVMADLCFNEPLYMLRKGEYTPWVESIFQGIKEITTLRAIKWLGAPVRYLIDEYVMELEFVRAKSRTHWRYSSDRVDKRLTMTPTRRDLWSQILEKAKGPDALTLNEHHAAAVLFMGAGTETTATALSGTLYHLLKNPSKLARLTAELRTTFPTIDDFTLDGLGRCEYLRACISEGMRMYPPVPIALPRRTPAGGSTIDGHFVPGHVAVGIPQLASYTSAMNFARPKEFHPERWLASGSRGSDPIFKDDNLAALEPFSTGPRNCLGKNLAWHEIRLLLGATLLSFDVELCEESKLWAESQKVYILWEKTPLLLRLTPVGRKGAKLMEEKE